MARAVYYVVLHENQWKIKFNDTHYGPYSTQKNAIDTAVTTAKKAWESGHESQVLVQGENNQFRTEWTYGNDPKKTPG